MTKRTSTNAERAVDTKLPRPVVWRRLKEAGARANGLRGLSGELDPGQAVAKRFARDVLHEAEGRAVGETFLVGADSVKEGDDGDQRGDAADRGQERQSRDRALEGKQSGEREDKGEQFVVGGAEGEGQEFVHEDDEAVQGRQWDIRHGSRSLAATVFAAMVLLFASLPGLDGPRVDCLAAGLGLYGLWLVGAFGMECWRCARGLAPVPAVLADVRIGLLTVALAFLWSGDPAAAGLAGWIAASALAIGGLADGGWIAMISLRREVPPWRAIGIVCRESRDAWRAQWFVLYGRTLR